MENFDTEGHKKNHRKRRIFSGCSQGKEKGNRKEERNKGKKDQDQNAIA